MYFEKGEQREDEKAEYNLTQQQDEWVREVVARGMEVLREGERERGESVRRGNLGREKERNTLLTKDREIEQKRNNIETEIPFAGIPFRLLFSMPEKKRKETRR